MNFYRVVFLLLLVFPITSFAADLEIQKVYRTGTEINVSIDAANFNIDAGAQSKFTVLDNSSDDHYAITFESIYPGSSSAEYGKTYFLEKDLDNDVPVENLVHQSFSGFSSGPLVVPFKYRTNDNTLSGEATVGYYAGWNYETNFGGNLPFGTFITVTPFLSAGLTQVSVAEEDAMGQISTENKSGFTWATGFLIKNWDNLNIGLVYGQDRIGDSQWEHEGEGWLSLSVGWEL
ncbi:MAG: hypothetical protein GKR91_08480 [Pseudomonadales bacterium]|nr:hypothetical protein [Pseudomonadales bacterium]